MTIEKPLLNLKTSLKFLEEASNTKVLKDINNFELEEGEIYTLWVHLV